MFLLILFNIFVGIEVFGEGFLDFFVGLSFVFINGILLIYNFCYVVMIYFFCYFWMVIVFNLKEIVDNFWDSGMFIFGYCLGKCIVDYLEKVIE